MYNDCLSQNGLFNKEVFTEIIKSFINELDREVFLDGY